MGYHDRSLTIKARAKDHSPKRLHQDTLPDAMRQRLFDLLRSDADLNSDQPGRTRINKHGIDPAAQPLLRVSPGHFDSSIESFLRQELRI
jgi:hypothetical protein